MRILFLGDISGKPGRDAIDKYLPKLKEQLDPDVTIINADNAAHGFGTTDKINKELFEIGADCITTGNHVWDQREMLSAINNNKYIIRADNFPEGAPGQGACIITTEKGQKVLVLHLMARLFMEDMDCPFKAADKWLQKYKLGASVNAIFVDFHGEATSEKMAMGHYLDGRVSAVVGTHTHIPTADCQIFPKGTAYQTDAGMCGNYDSVIGVDKEIPIHKFVKKTPGKSRMFPAEGEGTLCGTLVKTDDTTGLATSIIPVRVGPRLENTHKLD